MVETKCRVRTVFGACTYSYRHFRGKCFERARSTNQPPPEMMTPSWKTLAIASLLAAVASITSGPVARADVYVADTYGNAIYKLTPGLSPTTFNASVSHPVGLALDSTGVLYSADTDTDTLVGTVDRYSTTGVQSAFTSGYQNTAGLAFDATGNLFLSNVDNSSGSFVGSIVKITPAGVTSVFASGLQRVRGLAFDAAGNLYAADLDAGSVYAYTPAGVRTTFATGFNYPTGIAFDATGNLFVCSQGVGVFQVTPAGAVSTFTMDVTDPRWLAFDPASGNLYVSDVGDASGTAGQGNVYLFTPTGARTTALGGLTYPTGIVVTGTPATATIPVATVAATTSIAQAGGEPGVFSFTLSAPSATDVKVAYVLKGTAVNGTDYTFLKGTVKIKAGKTSKTVLVVPADNAGASGSKSVKLSLATGTGYTVGTAGAVKVKIYLTPIIVLP